MRKVLIGNRKEFASNPGLSCGFTCYIVMIYSSDTLGIVASANCSIRRKQNP
jgi:hypothetical protein